MVESVARVRHVRVTPQKARRVVDLIRGKQATEAVAILKFAPQAAAEPVRKVARVRDRERPGQGRQGRASASTSSDLFVAEAFVDEGPTLKRFRPRAQGRACQINKRTSHITVVVDARARQRPRTEGDRVMGQKVNPHGFRLGITTDHRVALVRRLDQARSALPRLRRARTSRSASSCPRASTAPVSPSVEIERTRDRVRVDIHTARPGHRHRSPWRRGRPHPRRAREAHRQAGPAEHPRGQEPRDRRSARRPGHRRAARAPACRSAARCARACSPLSAPAPRASACRCSGRLGGAEMSRSEFYREGRVPLHTLRANIDYGFYEARPPSAASASRSGSTRAT